MSSIDARSLFIDLARQLGASVIHLDSEGCQLALEEGEVKLSVHAGAGGDSVLGCIPVRSVSPAYEGGQVLLGLYMNAHLARVLGFPCWCGLDSNGDALGLYFGSGLDDLTSERLSAMITEVHALRSHSTFSLRAFE
jgi:hypothetical protein